MCGATFYRASLGLIWTETFLYGIYVILFTTYVYLHFTLGLKKYLLVTAVVIFALSTASMANDFLAYLLTPTATSRYVCVGNYCNACPGTNDDPFEDRVLNLSNALWNALFTTNQLVTDTLLSYRCYIMWKHKRWITVFPVVLVLATAACGYVQAGDQVTVYRLQLHQEFTNIDQLIQLENDMAVASTALAIASNVLLTALIVARISIMSRGLQAWVQSRTGVKYRSIMATLIESGAIYAIAQIVNLILSMRASVQYNQIANAAVNQIVGIVPTLLMIRIGLGRTTDQITSQHGEEINPTIRQAHPILSRSIAFANRSTISGQETYVYKDERTAKHGESV